MPRSKKSIPYGIKRWSNEWSAVLTTAVTRLTAVLLCATALTGGVFVMKCYVEREVACLIHG